MSVPGGNILKQALRVIAQNAFQYYAYATRTLQANGQWLSSFNAPFTLRGSVQAVPRNLYDRYGLEFDKYYIKFFVSQNTLDVTRDTGGDMIVYGGQNYQVLSITPWFQIDGWVEILTVQVPNAPVVG